MDREVRANSFSGVNDFKMRENRNCTNVFLTQDEIACYVADDEETAQNMSASHVSLTRSFLSATGSAINLDSNASLSDSM